MMGLGALSHLFYPWGLLLQLLAIVHFIRRRPDTYWLYVILFIGPIGAAIYIIAEVVPDLGLMRSSFKAFPRRKRIKQLLVMVKDNPSPGNFEELGDLYFEEKDYALAKESFDRSITPRSYTLDSYYRRGLCLIELGQPSDAISDLEKVVSEEPGYDFQRATGMLAHAYALTGEKQRAETLFLRATETSTSSETYIHYAELLHSEGRDAEARAWAQKVLDKKATLPGYLKRRERPWFRSANQMLKQLPAA